MSILDGIRLLQEPQHMHSGGLTTVMFDVSRMLRKQADREYILRELQKDTPFITDYFCGLELGGALLALLLSERYNNGFAVYRKDGTHTLPPPPHSITLVDDVLTTGSSLDRAQERLIAEGYTAKARVVLIDRRGLVAEEEAGVSHG